MAPETNTDKENSSEGVQILNTSPKTEELQITPEFALAEQYILEGRNVFIHGKPGTGKSSFIKYIKEKHFPYSPYYYAKIAVLTPTGISALNVRGQTAFSCLQINPYDYFAPLEKQSLRWLRRRLSSITTFVINEISMVRADLLDAINLRLQQVFETDKLFGGRQIILVGDFYQLPPVVEDKYRNTVQSRYFHATYGKKRAFCFFSPAFWQGQFVPVEFTHVFRQGAELDFIRHLSVIREENSRKMEEALSFFNRRVQTQYPENTLVLCPRKSEADSLNMKKLSELPGPPVYLTAQTDSKTNWAHTTNLPPKILPLKLGAFVVILKNDSIRTYMNGTTGVVCSIETVNGEVDSIRVKTDIGVVRLVRETWHKIKMNERSEQVEDENTFYRQFPLRLAWALTIHKSQGMTLVRGCVDVGTKGAWAAGQVYVALSRIRSIAGLFLKTPLLSCDVITDESVRAFEVTVRRHISCNTPLGSLF